MLTASEGDGRKNIRCSCNTTVEQVEEDSCVMDRMFTGVKEAEESFTAFTEDFRAGVECQKLNQVILFF